MGFKLTTLVVIDTDCTVVVNPTTIQSQPGWLLDSLIRYHMSKVRMVAMVPYEY